MKLLDAAGTQAGKYNVTIHNAEGVQIGDGNTRSTTSAQ